MIYGDVDAGAMIFAGVAAALKVRGSELRLFGKPESFVKRRMGVALAQGENIAEACARARQAAGAVAPAPHRG